MKNDLLRAAILAALAGTAATAAHAQTGYTIHASGASAQRTFWENDLEFIANNTFTHGSIAGICTLIATTAALNPPVPDLNSLSCVMQARGTGFVSLPTNVNAGDTITLNYEAEFGSVWGISPFIAGSNANIGRRMLTCAGVTGYSRDQDTGTACLSAPTSIDIAISDMEPIFWALPDNWPVSDGVTSNGLNGTCAGGSGFIDILCIPGVGQPSLAQLQALESTWKEVNGEVFTVVVDNSSAPTNSLTNLSTQSARAIFTGQYSTWDQVPEMAGLAAANNVPIVVCRRDHGSGTQVATSLYFTLTECGGNNGFSYLNGASGTATRVVSTPQSKAGANPGALEQTIPVFEATFANNPIENFSTNDVKACMAHYPGQSIGILSLAPATTYTTLTLDNVPPNAHNAASGAYKYAVTTWAYKNTQSTYGSGSTQDNIATQLINDASKAANGVLQPENGSEVQGVGVWSVGANTPQVAWGITDGGLNPVPTPAHNNANIVPIQMWKTTPSKSSCLIPLNDNT
jgi:PBP superfamily domain